MNILSIHNNSGPKEFVAFNFEFSTNFQFQSEEFKIRKGKFVWTHNKISIIPIVTVTIQIYKKQFQIGLDTRNLILAMIS